MSDIHDDRAALFANLESAETQPKFWDQVADDVDWTVEGTHALCGRYRSKADFIAATFDRLHGVLVGGRPAATGATIDVRTSPGSTDRRHSYQRGRVLGDPTVGPTAAISQVVADVSPPVCVWRLLTS